VPGFVARDLTYPERTKTRKMQVFAADHIMVELTRHAAWLGREKLGSLLQEVSFAEGSERLLLAERLESAIADVQRIAEELRWGAASRAGDAQR